MSKYANRDPCTCGARIRTGRLSCDRGHFQPWVASQTSIDGVGRDAPIETNANGASQSRTEYHVISIDPLALLEVARVAAQGDRKYGIDNWRGIGVDDHLNHALVHVLAYRAGDQSDDHLPHAACRMLMALATALADERGDV